MSKSIIFAAVFLVGGGIFLLSMEFTDKNNQLENNQNDVIKDNIYNKNDNIYYNETDIKKDDDQKKEKDENNQIKKEITNSFIQCLAGNGVVIYGSRTCPACKKLSEEYKGYDNMDLIYVECTEDYERCKEEMLVGYVPAIQINGEIYNKWGSPENLAKETGCEL